MTLPPDLIVAVAAIVVVAAVVAVRALRGRGAAEAVAPRPVLVSQPAAPSAQPLPLAHDEFDDDGATGPVTPVPAAPARVGWPLLVTDGAGELDEAARVRLLADLGIVRAPWCVPILLRACEEETNPAVRRAALSALGGFRASADARSALELAVAANDADERAIASAALRTFV